MEINSQNQSSMSLLPSEDHPDRIHELISLVKGFLRNNKRSEPDFVEPGLPEERHSKKFIYVILACIFVVLFFYALFSATGFLKSKRNAEDIHVSGGAVAMKLNEQDILASLSQKEKLAFFTHEGEADSLNTGYFIIIPMKKIQYLEQTYSDFIRRGSPGENEATNFKSRANLIAGNPSAERKLQILAGLVKKGNYVVFELEGSSFNDIQDYDGSPIPVSSASTYYLVDNLKIVQEQYQR